MDSAKRMILTSFFALFFFSVLHPSMLQAQRWEHFSITDGLAGSGARSIIQDNLGNIWFCTSDGISRFDGVWQIFRSREASNLIFDSVNTVFKDMEGNLWFGTERGISKINPSEDIRGPDFWINYLPSQITDGLGQSDNIRSIIERVKKDKSNNIIVREVWFGSSSGGVYSVDILNASRQIPSDPMLQPSNWTIFTMQDSLPSNSISDIVFDNHLNIWASTNQGIAKYDELHGKIWEPYDEEDGLVNREVRDLLYDKNNNYLWIATEGGISKVNPLQNLSSPDNWQDFTASNTNGGLNTNRISFMEQDKKGNLWIGTNGAGAYQVNPSDNLRVPKTWRNFQRMGNDGISDNFVQSILEDNENDVWFGTIERGVSRLNLSWESFEINDGLAGNRIRAIDNDDSGFIWFATEKGLSRIDPIADLRNPNNWTLFNISHGLLTQDVLSSFRASNGRMWFGTLRGGITTVHPEQNLEIWESYTIDDGLASNIVNSIIEDDDGFLWFGTNEGVSRVDPRTDLSDSTNWQTYTARDSLILNDEVFSLAKDDSGNIWLATNGGLSRANPKKNLRHPSTWSHFTSTDGLIANSILSLFIDVENRLWIGTRRGLNKIDPNLSILDLRKPTNWTTFTVSGDGIAANWITSISQDTTGNIWIGTSDGVSKLEKENDISQGVTFANEDGLASDFVLSVFANKTTNKIWFGTANSGATRFFPKKSAPNTFLHSNYDIVTQNLITFDFGGSDLKTAVPDLRFSYRIDGVPWSPFSQNTFTTVFVPDSSRPTRHTFEVRAKDRDGNIDSTAAIDVFYRINPTFGGNIVFVDSTKIDPKCKNSCKYKYKSRIRLYIPPGVLLGDKIITLQPVQEFELSDSLVVVAYDISSPEASLKLNRPHTLAISFLDASTYRQDQLAIFRQDASDGWDAIGGKVKAKEDTLTITTAITEFGRYAVRRERANEVNKSSKVMTIQPRVINPKTPGQGFGGKATISFTLEKVSDVSLKVYDVGGRLVKNILQSRQLLPGVNSIEWDGMDRDDQPCRSGLYIVLIEIDGNPETQTIVVSNSFK